MIYKATSSMIGAMIDNYRTEYYGEDIFSDEDYIAPVVYCEVCGCDIAEETADKKAYNYDGVKYCKECFKDRLFDEYAEDYEESVVDYDE